MKRLRVFITALCVLTFMMLLSGCKQKVLLPSEMLNSEDSFSLQLELVGEVPRIGSFRILQGGCVTEDYAWFVMIDENNASVYALTEAYIIKYDRKTMTEIARSEVLQMGHANDITYLPDTNELYVINVSQKKISVVDPDTLVIKETKKMPVVEGYGIAYNQTRNSFVTAYGKAGMVVRDRELKVLSYVKPGDTTLVTQGIFADEKYVYHVLWSSESNTEEPDNMIFVYDWEGNLITKIPVGFEKYEPENISIVGDTIYIGFNDRVTWESAKIYAGKLVKE